MKIDPLEFIPGGPTKNRNGKDWLTELLWCPSQGNKMLECER